MTMALAGREFLSYDCQLLLLSPLMNKFLFRIYHYSSHFHVILQ